MQVIRPETVTLADAAGAFLAWLRGVRRYAENTLRAYEKDLAAFTRFCGALGSFSPREIRHSHVELYLAMLTEGGAAPATANRHLATLRTFWRFLRREGAATSSPAGDAFSLKEPERLPDYLSVTEQERLLSVLGEDVSPHGRRDFAVIVTALLTGLRCQELAHLRVGDVDLDAGVLRVVGKGNKERQGIIIPRLQRILWAYLISARPRLAEAGDPWLFPNGRRGGRSEPGAPLVTRSVYRIIRRRASPIVGRPVHPHLLRHSFASRLRGNGADLQLIQEALGHATIGTTTRYAHLSTPARTRALTRLLSNDRQGRGD
jgi:site-specific recombinase XerD